MYKQLAHELQKPNPDIQKLTKLLVNGRPQNFFDKMLNGLFYSSSLGLFTDNQENTFFHSLAQKGILSPILHNMDLHKENILKREDASLDDLYRSLNSVNDDGLTLAHIAVKTDPVALWWLMKLKAALTSNDYSTNVLSFYTNHQKINNKSPLEYIFEDDEITKNVFLKILKSGNWEFFDLFKDEIPLVQEKFKRYLKHIPNEAKKFQSSVALNSFGMLFQSHWEDILAEGPESLKMKRLMYVLNPEVKDLGLSVDDLSGSLKKELSNIDKIKVHILARCASLYLNKFFLPDKEEFKILKLEHATLERIFGSLEFNTTKFQAIKRYVEGLPDNSTINDSINVTTASTSSVQLEKLEEIPVKQDVQDTTPKSDPVTVDGISLEEVDLIVDKEDGSSTVNHISTSKIIKNSTEFKPEIEAKVDVETFAQEIFNILKEDEDCAEKIKDEKYSQTHALIYFASDEEFFNNLFNDLANDFETQKNLKVLFKDASSFFEEYIKTLPLESLIAVSKPKPSGQNKGQTPYELACKIKNDQVAKFLAQRGIELKLYTEETETLFQFAFKYQCKDTIKFLLFESSFEINWGYVLHQMLKYTNIEMAEDYANSSFDVVKDTTNKGSEPSKDGEYTVLNKGLSILKQLSRSLIKYDNSVASNQKKLFYQSKINNIKKIPELCKIIELLIEKEKLYYGAENDHIAAKTYTLLNGIKSYISKISESLDKIVIGIESELDSDYCDKIKKALKSLNKKILNSSCQDEIKEALGFLNKSILDEECRDEVKETLKLLNKNVLDGEYQAEVKEALKSLNKNLLNRNYQDRVEDALNSMDNLQSLVINKYPSDELSDAYKKMFENLKSGKVDYAPSLAGTSNPDVSICSGSQLSEYELSGDTDSVYNA